MPAKRGRTVQEQTARIVPETEATPYAINLFAFAPRYFITEAWLTKTEIAPAMKNAGTRHKSTCSLAYHFDKIKDCIMALSKRDIPTGRKYRTRKTADIKPNFLLSDLTPILYSLQKFCVFIGLLSQ